MTPKNERLVHLEKVLEEAFWDLADFEQHEGHLAPSRYAVTYRDDGQSHGYYVTTFEELKDVAQFFADGGADIAMGTTEDEWARWVMTDVTDLNTGKSIRFSIGVTFPDNPNDP